MVTSIVTTYSLCLRWHWHSHDFVTIDNNIIHNYKVYHIRNYYLFVHLRLKINNYHIGRTYFIFTMIIKVYYFFNQGILLILKLIIMTPYKKQHFYIILILYLKFLSYFFSISDANIVASDYFSLNVFHILTF